MCFVVILWVSVGCLLLAADLLFMIVLAGLVVVLGAAFVLIVLVACLMTA